jgi:hypothetical protein
MVRKGNFPHLFFVEFLEVDMFKKLSLVLFALIALPASAAAQFSMPINNPVLDTVDYGRQIRDIVGNGGQSQQSKQPQGQVQRTLPPNQSISLRFTPSKARTQANIASFLQRAKATNKAGGDELARLFASKDVVGMVGGFMRQNGLDPNNVAHTYTMYWIVSWKAVNQDTSTPSARTMRSVAAQAERAFSSTVGMAQFSDAQRQEAAENMIFQAAILDVFLEGSKGNSEQLSQLSSIARQQAISNGLVVDNIILTENGFAPSKSGKRGDAGEAVDGALPGDAGAGQLASASSAPAPSSGMAGGDIALLIAAVSAGAGGIFMIGKGIAQSRG